MNFPVSIKGVLVEAGRVVLLENERDEWELPGGRLEPGEAPETCLVREFGEELGASWKSPASSTAGCTRFCLNARSSSSPTV
jgi:ADP-ribose pyrophosphatase YjhB (NUDIX family)